MPARTVYLETFGCQMNELDSELVTGALRALGYTFTQQPDNAGVVLFNTCSVRDHAEQKVRSRLGELRERKESDPSLVVGVLGCMAERDGATLIDRFPIVDVLCGPGELDRLPALLDNAVRTRAALIDEARARDGGEWLPVRRKDRGRAPADGAPAPGTAVDAGPRRAHVASVRSARQVALQGNASRRSATLAAAQDTLELLDLSRAISPVDDALLEESGTPRSSAYVRITRGCNKFCTYCVVPFTRGAEVHRPPDHIVDECKRLADAGVIEITLLGQTVNHYRFEHGAAVTVNGVTQPQKGRSYSGAGGAGVHRRDPFSGDRVTTFADLLRRIHDEVPAIARLRFVTSYPRDFGDDVLEVMRDHPRICRYLHAPAQSGSDAVLARMNRGYTIGEYLDFIDRARAFLDQPEIGRPLMIAGDIIAGFCGETEDDHRATMSLIRRVRAKNCFIFKYSPRPGTTAFDRLPDDVPESVKRRRVNELLAVQQDVSDEISREQIGLDFDVLVEGLSVKQAKRARREKPAATPGRVALTIGGRSAAGGASDHAGACANSGAGEDDCGCDSGHSHVHDGEPHDAGDNGPVQVSGRTEGDLIVLLEAPSAEAAAKMKGRMVRARITAASGLALHGEVIGSSHE